MFKEVQKVKRAVAEDFIWQFLMAMLEDKKETVQSMLVERLGKGRSHVSTYKRRLLQAGVIDEPYRGTIRFALPGLREFLEEGIA